MKFVNTKSTIIIGVILVIIALSFSLTSSSEVVSKASSSTESSIKSKVHNKSKSNAQSHLKLQSKVYKEKFYSLDTPPGSPARSSAKSAAAPVVKSTPAEKEEIIKPKEADPNDPKAIILNDWLMVSSRTFKNNNVFPEIFTGFMNTNVRIRTDGYDFRINDAHEKDKNEQNNPEHQKHFWFRLTTEMIFYSSTKEDLNILGGNKIAHIIHTAILKRHDLGYYCFSINDKSEHDWKICSEIEKTRNLWYCTIQKLRGQKLEKFCLGKDDDNIVYRNVN